jgi:hypothetical protein
LSFAVHSLDLLQMGTIIWGQEKSLKARAGRSILMSV